MNNMNLKNNIICDVGILTSDSDTVSPVCVEETLRHLRGTSIRATTIDASSLSEDVLANFDVIFITGGEPRRIRKCIGGKGASAIRKFIADGGGYVGVCAGAVLATQKAPTLDLLPFVRCIDDNIWWASGIEGDVILKRPPKSHCSPIDKNLSLAFVPNKKGTIHAYHNGPLLRIKNVKNKSNKRSNDTKPIALFYGDVNPWNPDKSVTKQPQRGQMDGTIATVSGTYKNGRVVITSIHPEFLDDNTLLETMCLYASQPYEN